MTRVLLAGCGDLGQKIGHLLADDGTEVFGLRRSSRPLSDPLVAVQADLRDADMLTRVVAGLPEIDAIVIVVTADERTAEAYRATYRDGTEHLVRAFITTGRHPDRLVFVSSTAVYGQDDGSWVDEDSPTEPSSGTGQAMVEAERAARSGPIPATVVRFAGIYGPGRTRLIDQVRAGDASYHEQPRWTNRMHRDDCAAAVAHLLSIDDPAEVYCGVDDEPVLRREVLHWLAERLDAPEPREESGTSPRGAGKRVSNDRLRATGFELTYPTFREGYAAVLSGTSP